MRLPEEPDLPFQLNIVPMIDVIFAILTFFILSSLFLTRSEGLPVSLPQAINAIATENLAPLRITVTIDLQGRVFIDRQSTQLDGLEGQVRQRVGNREALVIIKADERVSHGRVVAVMDRLRVIQRIQLAIATRRDFK